MRAKIGWCAALITLPLFVFAQSPCVVDLENLLKAETDRGAVLAARIEKLETDALRISQLNRIASQNIALKSSGNIELERQIKLEMAKILSHDPAILAGEKLPLPIDTSYSLYGRGSTGGGGKTVFFKKNSVIVTSMIGDTETILRDCAPHEAAHTLHVRVCGRIEVPRWVNEGLATLEERPASIQKLVYDPLKDRSLPQLSELLAVKEYPKDIELFYAHGAAFSEFLLSRLQDNLPSLTDRSARFMVLAFSLVADDVSYRKALEQYKAQLGMQGWDDEELIGKTEQEFREWLYQKTHK
jgi:hypothetical protein